MADPTSIIGVVSASVSLADLIYRYTSSFKHAPKHVTDLGAEVTAVSGVLGMLRDHLQRENAKGNAFERTSVLFFAADGCNQRLQEIHDVISPLASGSKASRLWSRLKWPLNEDDTFQEVAALHRYAQMFEFALNIDGFAILSTCQTESLAQLQRKLDNVLACGEAQSNYVKKELYNVIETVKTLLQTAAAVEETRVKVDQLAFDKEMSVLLNSLPTLPFDEKQRDLQLRRMPGLGQWLLNMPKFKEWCEGSLPKSALWCHGAPGAGKTFLTSVVIDHLEARNPNENCRLVYFYFDYRQQSEQMPFQVVTCLLKQILTTYSRVPSSAASLLQRLERGKGLPSLEKLIEILVDTCAESDELFLVLDALDECDENTNRPPILELLKRLSQSAARLFITSRSYSPDINSTLKDCPQITIEATDSDVRAFLHAKIRDCRRMSKVINETLREEVVQVIVENSEGMFLLPALQISNILSQTNESEVREALLKLPTGLFENLDLAMERIGRQDPHSQARSKLAMNTLMWLSHARRPLTIDELKHAIGTRLFMTRLDPSNLTDATTFAECCLGLVTIDEETSIVRLVHMSVNEYLQERRERFFLYSHGTLAVQCLAYLSLVQFENCLPEKREELDTLLSQFPFLDYSAIHWGEHAAMCFNLEVEQSTRRFLTHGARLQLWGQLIEAKKLWKPDWKYDEDDASQYVVRDISTLHIAARFGIGKLAQDVLDESGSDPNPRDSWNRTPLMLAAAHGDKYFLEALLSRDDIDVNMVDSEGRTALGAAVHFARTENIQVLISCSRVDPNLGNVLLQASEQYFVSSIENYPSQSVELGYEITETLLSHPSFDVNTFDSKGQSPWVGESTWEMLAKHFKFRPLQHLLARKDLDPCLREDPQANTDMHALQYRVKDVCDYIFNSDHQFEEELVNVVLILRLLEQDPRFPMPDYYMLRGTWPVLYYVFSWTTLGQQKRDFNGFSIWGSSQEYRDKVLAGLEMHEFTLTMEDSLRRTFLHYAAKECKEEHVRFLLGQGLDVAAADDLGWTPLHWAAKKGDESIVRMLLDSGASASAEDQKGRTPLDCAAEEENELVVLALLAAGADASASDEDGWTSLHWAAKKGNRLIVEILLSNGANAAAVDKDGWTPLHSAAYSKSDAVVHITETLVEHGAEVSPGDRFGVTPLHLAARDGRVEMCRFLLAKGADANAVCSSGTPLSEAALAMDEHKIRAILLQAGDLNKLDLYGRSSGDWIANFMPLARKLGSYMMLWNPTPPDEARHHLLCCLRERIEFILTTDRGDRDEYYFRLGKQLLFLGDEISARIAFGFLFGHTKNKPRRRRWYNPCDNCDSSAGIQFVCKRCPASAFCAKCVKKRAGDAFPWCQGHEFLEVPSDGWMNLPEGVVNEEGQSFEEWLKDLKRNYCSKQSGESLFAGSGES